MHRWVDSTRKPVGMTPLTLVRMAVEVEEGSEVVEAVAAVVTSVVEVTGATTTTIIPLSPDLPLLPGNHRPLVPRALAWAVRHHHHPDTKVEEAGVRRRRLTMEVTIEDLPRHSTTTVDVAATIIGTGAIVRNIRHVTFFRNTCIAP